MPIPVDSSRTFQHLNIRFHNINMIQSNNKILVEPKCEIILVLKNCKFVQYCNKTIEIGIGNEDSIAISSKSKEEQQLS